MLTGNASLRVKLSLLVTAVLLTVLIACQVALYFYVAENVERQARSAADVTLTQAQTYMDAKLRNVVERLFYIRLDPSFEGALTDYLLSDKPSAQGVAMTAAFAVPLAAQGNGASHQFHLFVYAQKQLHGYGRLYRAGIPL